MPEDYKPLKRTDKDVELKFCQVVKDEILCKYESIEDMLWENFYPGNYTPTQNEAKQLIKAAALSAARWLELKKLVPLRKALTGIYEETGEPFTENVAKKALENDRCL